MLQYKQDRWLSVRRFNAPNGSRTVCVNIGKLQLDSFDMSVSWQVAPTEWRQGIAFRCTQCMRFTLGCRDHWLCGLCEPCRHEVEDEDADGR